MSLAILRHALKSTLAVAPEAVRRRAARLPFSRFHPMLRLLEGREVIEWESLKVEVEPSEPEGYLQYFLGVSGATAAWEIDALVEAIGSSACTVFDVGAHAGVLSLSLAARCPQAQVVAFEPDERVAARLTQNLALNPILARRIQVVESAVGDRDGSSEYFPGDHGAWERGSLVPRDGTSARLVATLRLDSFCRQTGCFPDVVKIDVEGGELDVLQGMSELPEAQLPHTMLIEVHGFLHAGDAEFASAIQTWLLGTGYTISELTPSGPTPARRASEWPDRIHIVARRDEGLR